MTTAGAALWAAAAPVGAQQVLDRVDPSAQSNERAADGPPATPAPAPVVVESSTPLPPASTASITVGAITFSGLSRLTPADFAGVIEPYLGRVATPQDLQVLTGAVAARARARGYVFATAAIAPQRLTSGVLLITVEEGRIDAIRLQGDHEPAVLTALQPLVTGLPVTLAEVERRLLIAGDVDGVRISGSRFVREGGRGILVVTVARTRLTGRVALRNDGTAPLGPVQASVSLSAAGLLAVDDILSLTWIGTPFDPEELNYGRVRYAKRVSEAGTEVAVSGSISASRPGAYVAPFRIRGESWFAGVSLMHPLARRRASSLWLDVELDVRDLAQDRAGTPVRRDRLAVARLGAHGFAKLANGRVRGGLSVARGLDLFGATEAGDPLASRNDADGTFTTFDGWADWTRPLGAGFSVRAAMEAQVATEPLLVSEEVGLGGSAFLRAYDWSERSGDHGAMGSLEVRLDLKRPLGVARNAQLYTFFDAGHVSDLRSGRGGGSLASTGGGMRTDIVTGLSAAFEMAIPLTGPRYETGDRAPRVTFGLAKSF
jgi:hemolysin activation/secretion protein